MAAGSIVSCLAATSTQQPWQRRLQLLMTDTYRNGGNTWPRLSRDLWRWMESIPLRPMFHASFHSERGSDSNRRRLARCSSMRASAEDAGGGIAAQRCLDEFLC